MSRSSDTRHAGYVESVNPDFPGEVCQAAHVSV